MRENFSVVLSDTSDKRVKKAVEPCSSKSPIDIIKGVIRRSSEIENQTIVIKLPSIIIENDNLLTNFAENIQLINTCGAKVFIVHDYTNLVSGTLKLFGFDEKFINDIKVSDHRNAHIVEMVLSGYINKLITSKLCNIGCNAVGISCKDANLIQAKKSKLLYKASDNLNIVDVGFISEPIMVNPELLLNFEDGNIIPVISPVASDENGMTHLLDVDLTASIICSSLDADHLILPCENYIFGSKELKINNVQDLQELMRKSSFINNPKVSSLIQGALSAIENGDNYVHFIDAKILDSLLLSLFTESAPLPF